MSLDVDVSTERRAVAAARARVVERRAGACCAAERVRDALVSITFVDRPRDRAAQPRSISAIAGPTDVISFGFTPRDADAIRSSATSTSARRRARECHRAGEPVCREELDAARRARRAARARPRPSGGRARASARRCGGGRNGCCALRDAVAADERTCRWASDRRRRRVALAALLAAADSALLAFRRVGPERVAAGVGVRRARAIAPRARRWRACSRTSPPARRSRRRFDLATLDGVPRVSLVTMRRRS